MRGKLYRASGKSQGAVNRSGQLDRGVAGDDYLAAAEAQPGAELRASIWCDVRSQARDFPCLHGNDEMAQDTDSGQCRGTLLQSLHAKLTVMWNRACPLCFGKVPRTRVLTRSEDLECPTCHASLELSRPSRVLGAAVGLGTGLAAAEWTVSASVRGEWILAVVAGLLGCGIGSAVMLFFVSDLVVGPELETGKFPHHRA